jgi:aspartate racemase
VSGRAVGVIGGMGPAATVAFLARLQALTPARRDQDHLRLLVDCNPLVPDRNAAARGEGPEPGAVLAAMARGLAKSGAELLVMPCNAAHAFAADIRAATPLPFIDLIEAACEAAVAHAPRSVGILAADGCLEAGLYQNAFAERRVATMIGSAEARARFMRLLYRIKAGETGAAERAEMRALAQGLLADGADVLLAGCTEIPLVLGPDDVEAPLVDSVEALARRTVAAAFAP